MDEALIARFSPYTQEEQRLLCGGALDMREYAAAPSAPLAGEKLIPRDRLIAIRPHTRFAAFPPHSHDYVEAMLVLHGRVTHRLDSGEAVTLEAGELLFLNRFARHAIDCCGKDDIAVNFIVQPEFFDFALELVGPDNALGRFLLDALRSGESDLPYLCFRIAQEEDVQGLLQSMLCGFLRPDGGHGRIHRVEMGLLFLHLLAHSDRMLLPTAMRQWNQLAVELLGEIRRSYRTFSLKAFAAKKGVSAAYLSRVAREATGLNCTQLLWQRRMEKARQLLLETDMSILSVSQCVGYENSSYFYRLFEQRFGVSPKAYRGSQRT